MVQLKKKKKKKKHALTNRQFQQWFWLQGSLAHIPTAEEDMIRELGVHINHQSYH